MEGLYDYKGWFWDDVNKRMYRWHELEILLQERKIKKEREDADKLKDEGSDV